MKRILLFALLFLLFTNCFAQTRKIDSIKLLFKKSWTQKEQLVQALQLCDEYETLPKDSLWKYATIARSLAAKQKNGSAYSLAVLAQANTYIRWNNSQKANSLITPELVKYKAAVSGTRAIYFKLAGARIDLMRDSSYKDVLTEVYHVLDEAERYKDSMAIAENMNTIGALDYDMDKLLQAKQWLLKALQFTADGQQFSKVKASICLNLSDYYWWTGKQDSAAVYVTKAEQLGTRIQNLFLLSVAFQKRAAIDVKIGHFGPARQAILKSLEIITRVAGNEPQPDKILLLGSIYEGLNQPDSAIEVLKTCLLQDSLYKLNQRNSGDKNKSSDLQRTYIYQELAKCYRVKGDDKRYELTLERIIADKDSFYKANSALAIEELETKYQVQKKESTITRQRLELVKENYFFYGSILVLLLTGIILWLIFRDYRRKQRRSAALAVTDAEETERRRIAADLHDNLGAQLSFIKRNVEFLLDQPDGFEHSDEQRYLYNLNDIAKSAMIDLRETIWVLNKEEVFIQEFIDKLKFYLRQQLTGGDRIEWSLNEQVAMNWQLSSGEVMHLFRIVQELVSNTIKHSAASKIDIGFTSLTPNTFSLTICDNGKGFDLTEKRNGHYGLANIRQRAKELKALLNIKSDHNGTHIRLEKFSAANSL